MSYICCENTSEEVKNSDRKNNIYTCDQEREPGVGCGHPHRCRAGPLTIQVVDDFVPGGGVLGYEVINLLQNREAHQRAELRYARGGIVTGSASQPGRLVGFRGARTP